MESSLRQLKEKKMFIYCIFQHSGKLKRILMWNTVAQHLAKHTLPMTGGLSLDEFGNRNISKRTV